MKNYFSSDYHLSHANVIKYDGRPFNNIWEMDAFIMNKQKEIVKPGDNFYFLGDFCFDTRRSEGYIRELKGNLFFLKGNHDKKDTIKLYEKYGVYLGEQKGIVIDNQHIVLNHFSMRIWDRSHHGSWHLYGHSHGRAPDWGKSMDVGCMIHKYVPLEFDDIRKILEARTKTIIDQRGTKT